MGDSVKSYEDAGYDNEEDYLFDQYGGIGGTAEERAELANALMHTLNVGPMADELFYEEVAMCFLRCRERHRMKTRREEIRQRKKKMSKMKGGKGRGAGAGGAGGGKKKRVKKKKGGRSSAGGMGGGDAAGGGVGGIGRGSPFPVSHREGPTTASEEEDADDRRVLRERMSRMNVGRGSTFAGGEQEGPTAFLSGDEEDDDDRRVLRERMSRMKVAEKSDAHISAAGPHNNPPRTRLRGSFAPATGVESEYEFHDHTDNDDEDDNNSVELPHSFNSVRRDSCNVDSDYEGMRIRPPRQQHRRASFEQRASFEKSRREQQRHQQQQHERPDPSGGGEPEDDDDNREADVDDTTPSEDDLSIPSTPMSSTDKDQDDEDETHGNDSFMNPNIVVNDVKGVYRSSHRNSAAFKSRDTKGFDNVADVNDDDDNSLDVEPLDHHEAHSKQPPLQQQHQQQHQQQQRKPPNFQQQQQHNPVMEGAPVFRVDLRRNGEGAKKGFGKGVGVSGNKYPPPPPPPPKPPAPPPRPGVGGGGGGGIVGVAFAGLGVAGQAAEHAEPPLPMDVDEQQKPWEEKMARAARAAAEASALRNDHESLRREFSMGQAEEGGRKHRQPVVAGKIGLSGSIASGFLNSTATYFNGVPLRPHDVEHPPAAINLDDDDEEANAKRQRVAALRDEGRTHYINGAYRDCVLSYTAAISVHTNNVPFDHLQTFSSKKTDATLAALFGNRAAALMMTGAYSGASADCNRALSCTDANSNGAAYGSLESGPSFRSKILCRMARALLKAGSIWEAENAFNSSIQSAREALTIVGQQSQSSATAGGLGPDGNEEMRNIDKILNQSITDATLGLSDVKRCRDTLESATKTAEATKGLSLAANRRNDVQLLMFINSALSVSPGSMELHDRKVNALASLKRWAELSNHCERLAAEIVKVDGLFTNDLANLNPFPDVRPASALKPDFFEKNPDDMLDPISLRILSPKAVCDAVIRLPNGILPFYLRSLRLEERYTEAAKAGASIESHMSNSKHKGNRGNVSVAWLANERDKLRRTMSWKEQGDTLFRNGDYERAAEKYALCLTIDSDVSFYNENALENEDSGGRLHAVLHCNRAACLMALKKYREAVKECTAALRIHTHYMKAMLRRGRCFARIRQYQEAIAEYERYVQLVNEARRSPQNAANSNNAACTFDRPIDIAEAEYTKAKQELADVRKSMRQSDVNEHAQKKKQREQQFNFNKNFKAAANDAARRRQEAPSGLDNAYVRKKQWDAAGNNQRPWDTFGGSSPKKTTSRQKSAAKEPSVGPKPTPNAGRNVPLRKNQSKPSTQQQQQQQQQSQQQQQQQPVLVKVTDASDHYQVLGLTHTATSAEIKKGYHKAALKYHPDKNSDEGAADMFRRVKLAYEVLGNDQTRMSYDAHRRLNSNRR